MNVQRLLSPRAVGYIAAIMLVATGSIGTNLYNRCCNKGKESTDADYDHTAARLRTVNVVMIVVGLVLLLSLLYRQYGEQARAALKKRL